MLFDYMEDVYKEALRNLRSHEKPLFKGFSVDWLYKTFKKVPVQTLPEIEQKSTEDNKNFYEQVEAPVESEKKQVLESFAQFTQEKLEESPVYNFKGGQVTETDQLEHTGHLAASSAEFLDLQNKLFPKNIVNDRFGHKNLDEKMVKVIFISDSFVETPDVVSDSSLKEMVCFFDEGVSGLFDRMIKAMGLKPNEYLVTALHPQKEEENFLRENLISEILYFNPEYIVTLGAKAVNELLGTHKRLKNIHGQFFDLNFTDQHGKISKATLMPLFSPKLLHIAPNMKQTAWKDMQKLMEKL